MNIEWHKGHRLPKHATLEQRLAWHRAHREHCACRPIPLKLRRWLPETRKQTKWA